jgi:DNA polymerase II small subunit/DNA polymerase delta subunit B
MTQEKKTYMTQEKNTYMTQEMRTYMTQEKNTYMTQEKRTYMTQEKNTYMTQEKRTYMTQDWNTNMTQERRTYMTKERTYMTQEKRTYMTQEKEWRGVYCAYMHHIRKYYSISSFQTIPEQEDMADDNEGQEVKTTKRIPREADFLTYSCDSYCLKIQSGGDFVCHILQKMKTVWLALFLFEMLPQQDFLKR